MRFVLFFLVFAGCAPNPPPCANCDPQTCPEPGAVVPNAKCSVVPLVCDTPCGMKCQCWPDDAGVTVWISTTACDGGTDASFDASASAGADADASAE